MSEKEKRALSRWDPFGELEPFFGDPFFAGWSGLREFGAPRLARMLEEMFGVVPARAGGLAPALDVVEDEKQYTVSVELPGARRDDVTIECHEGVLTIRGEKKSEREEKKEQRRWVERRYGSFSRSFRLPANALEDQVRATFKDGVLTLVVPKREEAKPRVVNIQ
jgi:HSP20 family protein